MLKTIDILNSLDLIDREEIGPMIKLVNIPDFYKCIAQFAGLGITEVDDQVMQRYLITWAKNKKKFFPMLGNSLRKDMSFKYKHSRDDINDEIEDLSKEFPVFCYWLESFSEQRKNKIDTTRNFSYNFIRRVDKYFPQYKMVGSTITHFFKSCLKAPDELITKIAAIFENETVEANYTISIDPVDMMLASENPYNWVSCYRLETSNDSSHADGCLAAVLDSSSLITYVWNNEGKFKLYDSFEFKSIRYKRMREWISIAPDFTAIHFNKIYPGKDYEDDFEKQLREMVETTVCDFTNHENKWRRSYGGSSCYREHEEYGYNEYDDDYIYVLTSSNNSGEWYVYDEPIECPCGCGGTIPGSDNDEYGDDEVEYNGDGFCCENFIQRYYCSVAGDYCEYGYDNCEECQNEDCWAWRNEHPVCELDEDEQCQDPDSWDVDDGIMSCSEEHCKECPLYKQHHPDNNDAEA